MCGIIATLGDPLLDNKTLEELEILIAKRGPDYSSPACNIKTDCNLKLTFKASVLHLRGKEMQKQPVIDDEGNVLIFNGQIYRFNSEPLEKDLSDTTFLSKRLQTCKTRSEIVETFASIDGPFAFVYWLNDNSKTLFYGRDLFGRKSLCTLNESNSTYPRMISSLSIKCSPTTDNSNQFFWNEVDCSGVHSLQFNGNEVKQSIYTWQLDRIYPITRKCYSKPNQQEHEVEYLQIETVPLSDISLSQNLEIWQNFTQEEHVKAKFEFEHTLLNAISQYVKDNRKDCLDCRQNNNNLVAQSSCNHSKFCVAFSGGIDCTMLALFLDSFLDSGETIDLTTVAFKPNSPDRHSVGIAFRELRRLCPRRNYRLIVCDITEETLNEERTRTIGNLISPCKTIIDDSLGCACWFIAQAKGRAIDSLLEDGKFDRILDSFLQYNLNSNNQLDNRDYRISYNYQSPATILFAGMGIDEQLGGYSSHKAEWSRTKSHGLIEEISFQMRRLPSRNLGRDDRTLSHFGRDVKLPYLDEALVSFLNRLPVGLKMSLDEPPDIGPKKLLRELAHKWGLEETSRRVKRALQFGARIANSKEKGGDICSRLL